MLLERGISLKCFLPVLLSIVVHRSSAQFECRGEGCCDHREHCAFWAGIGECRNNRDWMRRNCQISCNSCPTGSRDNSNNAANNNNNNNNNFGTPTCQDRDHNCDFWAGIGECQANRNWMLRNCPRACGVCQGAVRPAVQPSNNNNNRFSDNVCSIEVTSFRRTMSLAQVTSSNSAFGCTPRLQTPDCSQNACYNRNFRTMDGSCNNEARAMHGAAFTEYLRLRSPEYDNGVSSPVGSNGNRPSARDASRLLLSNGNELTSAHSAMMMQWGQFLTHDLMKTTHVATNCNSCQNVVGQCFPIATSFQDRTFGGSGCLAFQRSSATCGTGDGTARQQYNENTAFIDGSMIYGSSTDDMRNFRNGNTGFMRTSFVGGRVFPPVTNNNIDGGDNRANLFVGLAALHALFVREHNRIAGRLQSINPHWDGDRLFQTTRLIVGAQMQAITYHEYLPKLLGSSFDTRIGGYGGYRQDVRPDMANSFASCAFRFGHGMIQEFYPLLDQNFNRFGGINFAEGIQGTQQILNQGIDPILRGMMGIAAKLPQRLTTTITERLFGNSDLAALNIQRGRDHGLGGYNSWREFCGMGRGASFEDFRGEIQDAGVREDAHRLYGHPDNVDMYVGALLEEPAAGGLVGPLLGCLIGEQFKRTRDGDRFYFENTNVFTAAQAAQLRQVTLSRVLCDSGDAFFSAPRDAFMHSDAGSLVSCQQLPAIDLNMWRD